MGVCTIGCSCLNLHTPIYPFTRLNFGFRTVIYLSRLTAKGDMELHYTSHKVSDNLILTLHNEIINFEVTTTIKDIMLLEVHGGCHNVVLDLNSVRYMDSSGLGVLLFGKRLTGDNEGNLCLVGVAAPIQFMLNIAKLLNVFRIYDTVEDALKSL